jgi:VWFA-related protein
VTLALATFGIAIGAQTPPPSGTQQRQPPIRAGVNYVRVDAYPTRDGKPLMDLRAEDFEVFENGAPQAITAFEHVLVSPGGPQAQRVDPSSVTEAQQAAANPRNRVVIVFLDTYHATIEGTWNVREPLIRLIDRILAPDDLVAIMTPQMAPSQITLARKTEVIEKGLRTGWPWGVRHTLHEDEEEARYQICYPPTQAEVLAGRTKSELAEKMTNRRRERLTLEAVHDLVRYLRYLRDERKAVLTISEGWLLYRPDSTLTAPRAGNLKDVPGPDEIGIGIGGKIRSRETVENEKGVSKYDCDVDRMRLAQMDNDQYFRTIIDDANRGNTTFYPVDPRGLAVFDSPIGPEKPPSIIVDLSYLRKRMDTLQNLAVGTDGITVMSSNDLDVSLKRIADDLTSYYLLGYNSTNTKLDGTYRRIEVKVKRPGVDVRARRGYRAPTEEEVRAAREAAEPAVLTPEAAAREAAMGSLARIRSDARFRIHAAPEVGPAGGVSRIWVAGELRAVPAGDPWSRGGTADLQVSVGDSTATARVTLAAGERTFLTSVALPKPATGDALDVRARLAGADPDASRLADSIHVPLAEGARYPILFRRGPTTGNRYLPAATFLFSRTERVRIEVPIPAGAKPANGRLLDKAGQPLEVPVTLSARTDDAGTHWLTADITLAPLGAGDYVVETSFTGEGVEHKAVTAIRVTR